MALICFPVLCVQQGYWPGSLDQMWLLSYDTQINHLSVSPEKESEPLQSLSCIFIHIKLYFFTVCHYPHTYWCQIYWLKTTLFFFLTRTPGWYSHQSLDNLFLPTELNALSRVTLNFRSSCLYLRSAKIISISHGTQFVRYWGSNPGPCAC